MDSMTIGALARRVCAHFAPRLAFEDGLDSVTFAQFQERSNRLANALRLRGVQHGDRIAGLLMSGVATSEIAFAAAKLGAIFVPLNWRLAAPELSYILCDCSPKLLFASDTLRQLAQDAGAALETVIVADAAPLEGGEYGPLVAHGDPSEVEAGVVDLDPWILLYTSGTTGRPKGCVLGHRGWVVSTLTSALRRGLKADDCYLGMNPLFHVTGLGMVLSYFCVGASTLFMARPPAADRMLQLFAERCTGGIPLPATRLQEMLAIQQAEPRALRLRQLFFSAAVPELVDSVRDVLGAEGYGGYGQTEAGNFVSMYPLAQAKGRPGTVGQPLLHLDARIVDDDDQPCAPGQQGELVLRGDSVMLSYWNKPEATAETLRGGWLHTGDVMRMDEEGFLYFADRKKDLIKSGGENVYPREVELVLMEHPSIQDCAVIGIADARWTEAVKAFIVLKPGCILERAELVAWCRERIAGYKCPRYLQVIDAIPGREQGKVFRQKLRDYPASADHHLT